MQAKQIRTDRTFQGPPQLSSFAQAFRSRHELKPAYYFARWMVAIAQQPCRMRRRYPRRTGIVASDTRKRLVAGHLSMVPGNLGGQGRLDTRRN